jgi:hypothetical protein
MLRNLLCGSVLAGALAVVASCSSAPQTPVSPTGSDPSSTAANPDGSTLKISSPGGLNPTGGATVSSLRPTLTFTAATPRFPFALPLTYELEIQNALGTVVYTRENLAAGNHELQQDLTYADNYWFRVRGKIGNDVGPWSDFAQFRSPDPPPPPTVPTTPPPGGGLPFPVPAQCANVGNNGFPCVAAVAAQSVEWGRCAAGDGVGCHRFTRQVVFALRSFDPNWALITAAPGGHACNCFACGPSDGTMFREDTTVYAGQFVYDMIVGAGGPTPSLNWSFVGGPRPVDFPGEPVLCTP